MGTETFMDAQAPIPTTNSLYIQHLLPSNPVAGDWNSQALCADMIIIHRELI